MGRWGDYIRAIQSYPRPCYVCHLPSKNNLLDTPGWKRSLTEEICSYGQASVPSFFPFSSQVQVWSRSTTRQASQAQQVTESNRS